MFSALELREIGGAGFTGLSLTVCAGEAVGLCGLADAGHFAAGEAVFGLSHHTGGITVAGCSVEARDPAQAMAAGVGFVPRDRRALGLAPELSSRENLFLDPVGPWHRPIRSRSPAPGWLPEL